MELLAESGSSSSSGGASSSQTVNWDELSTEDLERLVEEKREREELEAKAEVETRKRRFLIAQLHLPSKKVSPVDAEVTGEVVIPTAVPLPGKLHVQLQASDLDGTVLDVHNKLTFTEKMVSSTISRRLFSKSRQPLFATEGLLVFPPDRVKSEILVQALDHQRQMNLMVGSDGEIKAKDVDGWSTTAMVPDVESLVAFKDETVFSDACIFNFVSEQHSRYSLYHMELRLEPNGQSFDKHPEHAVAQASFVRRIRNFDKLHAVIFTIDFYRASESFVQQVESGKFRFKAVDFMHYKFHEILAKFKRVMDREIFIDGIKLQIKSPADAVKIYQDWLECIDASKEEEDMFRQHRDKKVIRSVAVVPVASTRDVTGGCADAGATPSGALDSNRDGISKSAKRRQKDKDRAVRNAGTVTAHTIAATTALPPRVSVPATQTAGSQGTPPGHVCVSHLAEISGLFPGLTCTFGSKCKFKHEPIATVKKREALESIERGAGKKLTVDQATALKAYVEANCA